MDTDVTASGRRLHKRFIALGDMTGKTADEIIAGLRCQPTSISSMAHGMTLLQWQGTGCNMALLFDANGKFVEITHQYANYGPAPVRREDNDELAGVIITIIIILIIAMILVHDSQNVGKRSKKRDT